MLKELGEKAYKYAFYFSLVFTLYGSIALASGITPPDYMATLFLPMGFFYQQTSMISSATQGLGGSWTDIVVLTMRIAPIIAGVLINFIFLVLTIYIQVIAVMTKILPSELSFLVIPTAILSTVLQVGVWVYVLDQILARLSIIRWKI
jgi:hypothetical protein